MWTCLISHFSRSVILVSRLRSDVFSSSSSMQASTGRSGFLMASSPAPDAAPASECLFLFGFRSSPVSWSTSWRQSQTNNSWSLVLCSVKTDSHHRLNLSHLHAQAGFGSGERKNFDLHFLTFGDDVSHVGDASFFTQLRNVDQAFPAFSATDR